MLGRRDADLEAVVTLVLSTKVDQQLKEIWILINDRLTKNGGRDILELHGGGWSEAGVGVGTALKEVLCSFDVIEEDGEVKRSVTTFRGLEVEPEFAVMLE